jgi:protein-disulfide isomerase
MSKANADRKAADRRAKIEAARAQERRGTTTKIVVAAVAVLVIIGGVVGAIAFGGKDSGNDTASGGSSAAKGGSLPKGVSAMGAGLVVNPDAPASAPTLDLYEDFQCPVCGQFESIFGIQIKDMVEANQVKLVAHTLTFLDKNLRNDSSNRAANAAACAADADKFLQYKTAVFQGQPAQEGTGYTDDQLKQFAKTAGISGAAMTIWEKCYDDRTYNAYVESVQAQSEKDKVQGTPTIRLNGKDVNLQGLTQQTLADQVKAATK